MNDYKRINTQQASRAPGRTEYDDALATMGMRIRKAVAEGYNVPSDNGSHNKQYNRQPLPSHIDQPPALTNQYSTMDSTCSSSNLSEWQQQQYHQPQLVTIDQGPGPQSNKRKFVDDEEYVHPQYGALNLDENF